MVWSPSLRFGDLARAFFPTLRGGLPLSPHALGVHKVLGPLRPVVSPVVDWASKRRLGACVNVADLRVAAEKRMHRMCFGYLDSGADDEVTLRRSKDAFLERELHYRVLAGTKPETLDVSTRLMGADLALPFFGCPCAGNRMFHHEGEVAVAAVARERGSLYCLSTLATSTPSDVSRGDDDGSLKPPRLFQLYVWKDRALVRRMLDLAADAGFDHLALTVDLTWFGNRERDKRNGFTIPPSYSARQVLDACMAPAWTWDLLSTEAYTYANLDRSVPAEALAEFVNAQLACDFDWDDAAWLVKEWKARRPEGVGKLALKGVVRPDDAARAREVGFDCIWVSNHGGRQLDTAPAPLDVLGPVRRALGDDFDVVLDGGVQRGTDVVKALALGATAVGVGKPFLYGLGAGGKAGVDKCFDILDREVRTAMGLLGVRTVADLRDHGGDLVLPRPASSRDARGARYAASGLSS